MRRVSDPFVASVVALGVLGAAAFVTLALGWQGLAAEVNVATQVAFLVSGGIGGLALVGFASGVVVIQARRRDEAQRRAAFERVVSAATELLASVRHDPDGGLS